ncbi:MAG: sigma-70 family RNA polymerase sigma factor, partial [Pseudonocardiaceae bacterium]
MATQTRFRGPAAPGQAISLDHAQDEATRAAEAWVPPSWDQVVREHADRVYRLAYRLSGNPHDAEDLTQETFIRVFRSLGSYKPGTFEGWLHRITTNLFLDMV